jgi:flavin reductase (DIM6/NTAB) family NADH-FMN oxidoreductase RutF
MNSQIDALAFRQMMGRFTTGVAVVTAQDDKIGRFGLTINSLTSVSLDPALLLFCLDKKAHLHKAFRAAPSFAINLLAQGQEGVSRHFADRAHNPAPDHIWGETQQDCPVLEGTLGWILCRPQAFYDGGDHTIFVGEVLSLRKNESAAAPLVYFQGRYRELAEIGPIPDIWTSGARK